MASVDGQPEASRNQAGIADRLAPAALALAFAALYLRTLCPTVYLGDSGEIAAAIAGGGIVHPPGYPLFTLLGRAALLGVPVGEPAYRIGWVTALAAAAAVGVLYAVARELGARPAAAALAAAGFGASSTFWGQSTRVEVYSLHVLLTAAALLGAARYRRTGSRPDLGLAALAGGLGAAHHLTIALVAPAVLLLCGPRLWRDPLPVPRLLTAAGLALLGPLFYLLLPVWSAADPVQNWGRPETPALLWNHVSARLYQGALRVPTPGYLASRLRESGILALENLPWGLWALSLVGGWWLARRDRGAAAAVLVLALVPAAYNQCYHIEDIAAYFLPVWLAAFLLLGLGATAAAGLRPGGARVLALAAVALPAALVVRNWRENDLSGATWVREFARHKLACAPPDALMITHEDPDTFPVWYVHRILGVRPDVLPVDYGLLRATWMRVTRDPSRWYLHSLRRQGLDVPLEMPADPTVREQLVRQDHLWRQVVERERRRPLCLTFFSTNPQRDFPLFRWLPQRYELVPWGVLLRGMPRDHPLPLAELLRENARLWAAIRPPDLRGARMAQDMFPAYTANHYACMLVNFGGLYESAGRPERAAALYRQAAAVSPTYAPAAAALEALAR